VSSDEPWLRRVPRVHPMRHPCAMGEAEIHAFLSHRATEDRVSTSPQNQALAALLFLSRTVLGGDAGTLEGVIQVRKRPPLPVVLTVGEVRAVLGHQGGAEALVTQLLHGSGLRLVPAASAKRLEALRLRIKDVDMEQRCITVRCGTVRCWKGDKDRRTVLPLSLVEPLQRRMQVVRGVHQADLKAGWGRWNHPMPWSGNTGMREGNGPGNGCSPKAAAGGIPTRDWRGGTTWIRALCSVPCVLPCRRRGSASQPPATPSAIRSSHTCWSRALTFARFRSC
jgi:integrase